MDKIDNILKVIMGLSKQIRYIAILVSIIVLVFILIIGTKFIVNQIRKYEIYTPERKRGAMLMLGVSSSCILESIYYKKDYSYQLAFSSYSDIIEITKFYGLDQEIEEQAKLFLAPTFEVGYKQFAELRRMIDTSIEDVLDEEYANYYEIAVGITLISSTANFLSEKKESKEISKDDVKGIEIQRKTLQDFLNKNIPKSVSYLIRDVLAMTEPLENKDLKNVDIKSIKDELNRVINIIVNNYKSRKFKL